MITRLIIAVVMGLAGLVGSSLAGTLPSTISQDSVHIEPSRAPSPSDERGTRALAEITYPWQTILPEWSIEFSPATTGPYGMTFTNDHRIEVYIHPDQSDEHLSHVVAHELGHAVDVTLNSGDERREWQEIRGIEDADWWPSSGAQDFSTGAGDFAESFAHWQLGGGIFRSTLAGEPNAEQLSLMADLAQGLGQP